MTVHRFEPSTYYNAIGTYPPVLRVADGDTIQTTTLDAGGGDALEIRKSKPGNPQTGPFYVEGAEPGDVLAVYFVKLTPNRRHGWTGVPLAPNVVDPDYIGELPAGDSRADWDVDTTTGIATLVSPVTSLGRLELEIDPMLGCFGVAPPGGQAISTATSSTHGGNMDYRGFRAGATIYFPVAVEGALLFVGDCHAVQGDGEIVGTGIEISCDVEMTVRVIKNKLIGWPRAEDESYIMTAGNARPLDQALQHATTEMDRWLQQDYGFDAKASSILLGQCVRYEVGNVFDPAYTVVCKVEKKYLPKG